MSQTMSYLLAFAVTLFAGLATGIGALFVLRAKTANLKFLTGALGFSAGVMIYVSFMEIMPKGLEALQESMSDQAASWIMLLAFFGGIAVIALIDHLIPEAKNPHEMESQETIEAVQKGVEETSETTTSKTHEMTAREHRELERTGKFSALAIAIHNFPEGLATFISTLADPALGMTIAIAIAIHNIPEGISVAVPVFYATGDRRKALKYAFLSGLAEPIGALVGGLILLPFLNNVIMGVVFCAVAGIMVYISIDELLPSAEKYGEHHISIYGFIGGMALMAVSLVLLA